jgi:1-acyl-sn-glycerol-3-phosphate acyltransferase
MIRALFLLFILIVLVVPAAAVTIPWALITGNALPMYNAANWIVYTGYRLVGINVIAHGQENVPANTACIFMANHVSNLDPPALLPRIPGRTSAFVKATLLKVPIFGQALKIGEFVPVSRDGSIRGAQESVIAAKAILEKGLHITTFVEGTRSPDGRMLPFKKGPFYLAKQTGAPCIPVSIYGTEAMMSKGSMRIRAGDAHIIFHPPLYPAEFATRDALLQAVRAAIASGLPEWMRA